uniref:Condensation domain-containing protein n=1 Tax=Candidatus Kentrum sp. LFY TaxID=2126342 RepID=A0A450V0R3_9GAMM|nr:MAG: Condensation domain-containing protein [Candidatus Kentron sp. LFY]
MANLTSSNEYPPLSANQQGLWSLEQRFPKQGLYNLNGAWRLPADISFFSLRSAVERLSARHPALRTTFSEREGKPLQIVHKNLPIDFREVHVEEDSDANVEEILETRTSQPLDLEKGPLARWVLISVKRQRPGFAIHGSPHHSRWLVDFCDDNRAWKTLPGRNGWIDTRTAFFEEELQAIHTRRSESTKIFFISCSSSQMSHHFTKHQFCFTDAQSCLVGSR